MSETRGCIYVIAQSVLYYEAINISHYFVSDEPPAYCSYPQWWWFLSVGKVS